MTGKIQWIIAMVSLLSPTVTMAESGWSVGLQELDLSGMRQGWGSPQVDKSVSGNPLSIGGRKFAHGVGTHAVGSYAIDLHGTAERFRAWVGVDDDAQAQGSVTFQVAGDGKVLWESGVMRASQAPKEINIELKGVRRLALRVGDAGDGNGMDHADWADAQIDGYGPKPGLPPCELDLGNLRKPDLAPKPNWDGVNPSGDRIAVNAQYIERNGKPWIMVAGEMHPTRYPASGWEEQILKMKAGGLNTISVYIFWNHHEEDEGVLTWTGNRDIRHFIELCARHGMYVFLRVGPFCNGECIHGGLPQFLKDKGVRFRTNDPVYLGYVRKLYQQIGRQMRGLMFKDGGPILAVQLENEFEHAPTSWGFKGEGGEEHMRNLKRLAIEAGLLPPIYVCTAWGSPVPPDEFLPGQGGYPFMGQGHPSGYYVFFDAATRKLQYDPSHYPVANIEIGPGMINAGQWRPVTPPESTEALALVFAACGGNVQGYYMYQAGTQFVGKYGSTSVWPWLSYDWHCPLREFGQTYVVYDFMKPVNFFQADFGDLLAPMVTSIPADPVSDPGDVTGLRYAARANGQSGFLFLNNYQDRVQMPDRHDLHFELKFAGGTQRIPERGSLDLKHNQCAILPFNLDLEGARLRYAIAQLYTRTQADDGRNVYVFFVPEGMDGQYVFENDTIGSVKAKSAIVSEKDGFTTVAVQPGTGCMIDIKSKSGRDLQILTLTRPQALRLTRQDVYGGRRIVLSDNTVVSAGGKLRVSQIGVTRMGFAVFPAPKVDLTAGSGNIEKSDDGVFRRYTVQLPEVKPDIRIEGIGGPEVKIKTTTSVLDGVNDVFLRVSYLGNDAKVECGGERLCDNLFDRTPWEIGLKRFREKLAGSPMVLTVSPPAPIIEVVDNREVNSGVSKLEAPAGDLLIGTYEAAAASPAKGSEKGYVASVRVLPEYAVWVQAAALPEKPKAKEPTKH